MTDVFIMNTADLKDAGFQGSFNDLADDFEAAGATVEGSYDSEGNPIMTLFNIDAETVESTLADYGIEDPTQFTSDESGEIAGDPADETDLDAPVEVEPADDGAVDIEGSGDGEDSEFDVPAELDEPEPEEPVDEPEEPEEPEEADESYILDENGKPKGTQNLSESATHSIIDEVRDRALLERICKKFDAVHNLFEGKVARMKALLEARREKKDNLRNMINEAEEITAKPVKKPVKGPYGNVEVNGKMLGECQILDVEQMLIESKRSFKRWKTVYQSLNESKVVERDKLRTKLKKQVRLIEILESQKAWLKKNALNEDEEQVGSTVATLTGIVFKVNNADEFIKTLVDNGIPEDVLEKVNAAPAEDEENQDDQQQDDQTPPADMGGGDMADMGGGAPAGPVPAPAAPAPGGGNPFESLRQKMRKNRLNEAFAEQAPAGGDDQQQDQPAPETDSDAENGIDPTATSTDPEGEEVRLKDTSYAKQVQEIIAREYNYPTEKFNEEIGGEIIDDEQPAEGEVPPADIDGSDDGSDGFGTETGNEDQIEMKNGEIATEDTINPEDVFGDI